MAAVRDRANPDISISRSNTAPSRDTGKYSLTKTTALAANKRVSAVGAGQRHAHADLRDRAARGVDRGLRSKAVHDDMGPLGGERPGDAKPDPAGRSGDQRHAPIQ